MKRPQQPTAGIIASGWKSWTVVIFLAPLALYPAWEDRHRDT